MTLPRVLLVSHTYAAPINRAKLDALAQHLFLDVVAPQRWRDALFDLPAQHAAPANYSLHRLPVAFDGHILRYLYSFRALSRIVREARPALVYVEEEPASLVLGQLAALKQRYRYKLVFFTWENIARRVGLPGVERYNLQQADGAIAGNVEAGQVLRRKGFRGPLRVTPQLGVTPGQFRPRRATELRRALGLNGFVVGYVGRLVEAKGLWTLLEAVRDLPDVRLLLVGAGPLQAALDRRIKQDHRLRERSCRVNAVPHEEIVRYLNTLDVLVLPSQTTPTWKEQFGHVLIEAMACAVPVIGSNSGAIPEVIAEAGLIFPEGDAKALRDAIYSLQANPSRREHLAQVGRERVLGHYTHERIATANAEFFRQVLAA